MQGWLLIEVLKYIFLCTRPKIWFFEKWLYPTMALLPSIICVKWCAWNLSIVGFLIPFWNCSQKINTFFSYHHRTWLELCPLNWLISGIRWLNNGSRNSALVCSIMLQAFWIWAYIILQIDNNVMKYNVRLILCDNSKSQVFFFKFIHE